MQLFDINAIGVEYVAFVEQMTNRPNAIQLQKVLARFTTLGTENIAQMKVI